MLTVGCLYFQAVADEPRIATDEAQGRDGTGAFDQATDQVNAGTTAYIDAMRSKEPQARQQQMKTKPISSGMPRNSRDHGIMTMITGPPEKHHESQDHPCRAVQGPLSRHHGRSSGQA